MPHDLGYVLPQEISREMVVTAIDTGSWQLSLLSSFYLLVALIAGLELARTLRVQMRTHGTAGSFRTTFLLLSFVVMVLRGVLVLVPFKHWSFFCLSFFYLILPIYLQFVTFTLLIVFFQKCLLVIKRQGARVRGCLYPTYLGTCVGLLFFCIILAGVITWLAPTYTTEGTEDRQREESREFDKQTSLYTSLSYFTLVLFFLFYGLRVYKILTTVAISDQKRARVNIFVFMALTYVSVFALRALWGLTYFFSVNPVMSYSARSSKSAYYTAFMIFYTVAEIFPTAMIVIVFHLFLKDGSEDREERSSSISSAKLLYGSSSVNPYYYA